MWAAVLCGPPWLASAAVAQESADAIKKDIGDLKTKLKGLSDAVREDSSVQQELATLRDTIFGIDCLDPRAQFACEFAKLKTAAGNFRDFFTKFTKDRQSRLTDADKADLKDGLKSLMDQLTTYDSLVESRIFIRGAWYGDLEELTWAASRGRLDPAQDGRRFCSATRFVQTWCQLQQQCAIKPSTDAAHPGDADGAIGSPLAGDRVCGYDPVQFADDRIKGLFIEYECRPDRGGARVRQFAVRRTAIATLTCEPPQ